VLAFVAAPVSGQVVQDIVSQVSQSQYHSYQVAIESAGLGLYDSSYNQGYRNRDGWLGGGSLGNQEARLYLSDQFTGMGLDVAIQGDYMNVVAELMGTVTPEEIYIVGSHYDTALSGERPGGTTTLRGQRAYSRPPEFSVSTALSLPFASSPSTPRRTG